MMRAMAEASFKQRIYVQFARVGQALASEKRLELLDLLAQGPRHVEALADLTGMSVANVSQHLQTLRGAGLVEAERDGTRVVYRVPGPEVLRLWLSLASVAESRLADIQRIVSQYGAQDEDGPLVSRDAVEGMMSRGEALLLDVRPALEYRNGHLPGAVSVPMDELPGRLDELPKGRRIVTYCRGTYCLMADEAVQLLRRQGFDAWRVEGGWPEWVAEERAVEPGRS